MQAEVEAVAGRWFALEVLYDEPERGRVAWWRVKWIVLNVISFGFLASEPRRPGRVMVVRRCDAVPVATFEHTRKGQIERHVENLAQRLLREPLGEFCRDLDIPLAMATGSGEDVDESALITWGEDPWAKV